MASPDEIQQLREHGLRLFRAGQAGEAAQAFAALINAGVADAEVYKCAGLVLAQAGQLEPAAELLGEAIARQPRDPAAHTALSFCRIGLSDYGPAEASARAAIAIFRNLPDAWTNLGIALNRQRRNDEALTAFETVVRLAPRAADSWLNLANVLRDLWRSADALAALDQSQALDAASPRALYNRGNVLQDLGRHRDALAAYDQAIALAPDYVDAHWNRSLCHLLLGEFAAGFAEYEWRWLNPSGHSIPRNFPFPLWLGDADLSGKVLLAHCEQGYGDAIQFIRYARHAADLGATVVVEALGPVAELFRSAPGVSAVITPGDDVPQADYHCPVMSLPHALRATVVGLPAPPAYLFADAERVEAWRATLGPAMRPRIGVVYAGSATHGNDHNRSIAAADMLAGLPPGADYILLQTDRRNGDDAILRARSDILQLDGQVRDFSDTAALCALCDLIVTVDTSVAHLAGALGRPVWVLAAFDPDWRWGLGRADSAWYPSASVIRQTTRCDWPSTLSGLRDRLAAWIAARP